MTIMAAVGTIASGLKPIYLACCWLYIYRPQTNLSVSHSVHSGHRSGWYASYWNALLFQTIFEELLCNVTYVVKAITRYMLFFIQMSGKDPQQYYTIFWDL